MKRNGKDTQVLAGYDGEPYTVGDRVEIHPGTDTWMIGLRYGTVKKIRPLSTHEVDINFTPMDQVQVEMYAVGGLMLRDLRPGSACTFRKVR